MYTGSGCGEEAVADDFTSTHVGQPSFQNPGGLDEVTGEDEGHSCHGQMWRLAGQTGLMAKLCLLRFALVVRELNIESSEQLHL